jgi:uncharacterized protein (DUF2062 family)
MPRKYFRKYLPTHEAITANRWIAKFGVALTHHNLWYLHRRSVAGGVPAGLFAGLIPGPAQMIAAVLLSLVFKVNLPVAMFTTLYTNPLTLVPLYLVAHRLGVFATGASAGAQPPAPFSMEGLRFSEWLPALWDWLLSMGKPLAVGLPLLGLLLALVGYGFVRGAWRLHLVRSWRRRALQRHATRTGAQNG